MSIQKYFEEMKIIQSSLLQYIEDEDESKEQENYDSLIKKIDDQKILSDVQKFGSLIHLIANLSDNHQRCHNFISKLQRILFSYREELKNTFSNIEIFKIFKNNKRIILYLISEKIIEVDILISDLMHDDQKLKYSKYFCPELKNYPKKSKKYQNEYYYYESFEKENDEDFSQELAELCHPRQKFDDYFFYDSDQETFAEEEDDEEEEIKDTFYENRQKGESLTKICHLIQKDLIDEFIVYVNQTNISLNSVIKFPYYETNSFLLEEKTTLIEYATFYGAIQIFKYLKINEVDITPSIFLYAIHSNNPEMIYILEENSITPKSNFQECLIESIKCHHNEIANYLIDNYYDNRIDDTFIDKCYIEFYNFDRIPENFNYKDNVFDLIQFGCSYIIKILLENGEINGLTPIIIK